MKHDDIDQESLQNLTRSEMYSRSGRLNKKYKKGYKKSHRFRNWFLSIIGLLITVGAVYGAMMYFNAKDAVNSSYDPSNIAKSRNVSDILKKGKPFSILLLGTDTGELGRNYKGRTDSIMYVVVNPKTKTTTMISLPRDVMTSIVGYEDTFPQKLNAAYAYGSSGTLMKTVQKMLNVPVDFYALVNMGGLETVVNKLGGIEVKSPTTFKFSSETAHDYGNDLYSFTKGSTKYKYYANGTTLTKTSNVMDGKAALAFARMRYQDEEGDYGRTNRQRLILKAIIEKALKNPTKVMDKSFMKSISNSVRTDLTFDDILTIMSNYKPAGKTIKSEHLQGESQVYNGIWYERLSKKERQRITDLIRKELGIKEATTGSEFGSYVPTGIKSLVGEPDDETYTGKTKANNSNSSSNYYDDDDYVTPSEKKSSTNYQNNDSYIPDNSVNTSPSNTVEDSPVTTEDVKSNDE